jgi:PAS domain S-box-containing protein
MPLFNVAIVGLGTGGSLVYQTLKTCKQICILGVADMNPLAVGMEMARNDGVLAVADYSQLFCIPDIDIYIEATGQDEVREKLWAGKSPQATVMDGLSAQLMMTILEEKQQLLAIKTIKGELDAILNSVQEGIEVADQTGTIKYINPSFSKISGIRQEDRIGANIFQASPQGALALCLKEKRGVYGHRTIIGGSDVEVVSNAAPIYASDGGEMVGAVVVFQPMTDVMQLMAEIQSQMQQMERLNVKFGAVTSAKYSFSDVLGTSEAIGQVVAVAKRSADASTTLLIMGESGTGKELLAHAVHNFSSRRSLPFIKVNCAAIPETLLESEFFGYEKGAFTGANQSKMGKFELANRGTIFLDEIGDMSLQLQGKLLRVLQEREIERVGGNETIQIDVRVIAATNRDLPKLMENGQFREDLYYRLKVIELSLPPLRRRKEDIPQLVRAMRAKYNRLLGKRVEDVSPEALAELMRYDWPGNLRELENVIERAVVMTDGRLITLDKLGPLADYTRRESGQELSTIMSIAAMEQQLIQQALARFGDTLEGKKQAAALLGISLGTLYNKLRKFQNMG